MSEEAVKQPIAEQPAAKPVVKPAPKPAAPAAAARKVPCATCDEISRGYRNERICPDCADLRRLLGEP